MIDIQVPKLNNNDTDYVLVEWHVDDGAQVTVDQPIVSVETSKAIEELPSPGDGVVLLLIEEGAACHPGEVIGTVFDSVEQRERFLAGAHASSTEPIGSASGPVLTDGARAHADAHGVTSAQLASLGKSLIRIADVRGLTDAMVQPPAEEALPDGVVEKVSLQQRAVAATVSASARSIPAAAAYASCDMEAALTEAARLSRETGVRVGVPELLIKAVAGLRERHPRFYARLLDDVQILIPDAAHVGVSIDVGTGLFIPVLRNTASLDIDDLVRRLTEFRMKARRNRFKEQEFQGSNILVSLQNSDGILLATPIVPPGHTCAISMGDITAQAVVDDGQVAVRRRCHLGLVYDHRVVNGREAGAFLSDLVRSLQTPIPSIVGSPGDAA